MLNDSKKLIVNLFLMILTFFLLIRPLLKSLKKMASEPVFERKQLAAVGEDVKEIGASVSMGRRERVIEMAKTNPERTEQLIKGWIGDKA